MKYRSMSSLAVLAIASTTFLGCNALKKMEKNQNQVNYNVTPSPLVLKGDSIQITVDGSFPPKYFDKRVSGEVTPTLNYGSGQTATFKSFSLKGESVEGDGTTIPYKDGGSFSYTSQIQYKEGMDQADLNLVMTGNYKDKSRTFDPIKVAEGTIITQKLVQSDDQAIIGKDGFKKTHTITSEAKIHYYVGTTNRIGTSLRSDAVKNMNSTVKTWGSDTTHYLIKSVSVLGYASPEGEMELNTQLGKDRSDDGVKYVKGLLVRNKVQGADKDGFYTSAGKGEDWEGFKKEITSSDVENKELITRVLEMYKDKTQRQKEIRNIASTYPVVKNTILPKLRRAEITINADSLSRSDDQITQFAQANPDKLSANELLYAASLTDDQNKKKAIYEKFTQLHSNDWRGPNNLGYLALKKNNVSQAKTYFDKANSLDADNKVVNNNLGVVARLNGNNKKALEYYQKAEGAGPEVKANMGTINIMLGNYQEAVQNFGGTKSFNAALAQLLNGNSNQALQTLEASKNNNSAISYYLKAVIAARNDDNSSVADNLKNATAKDASLKAKAKKDLEFVKYREDAGFQSAVN